MRPSLDYPAEFTGGPWWSYVLWWFAGRSRPGFWTRSRFGWWFRALRTGACPMCGMRGKHQIDCKTWGMRWGGE